VATARSKLEASRSRPAKVFEILWAESLSMMKNINISHKIYLRNMMKNINRCIYIPQNIKQRETIKK
jgi:hypothetical protein